MIAKRPAAHLPERARSVARPLGFVKSCKGMITSNSAVGTSSECPVLMFPLVVPFLLPKSVFGLHTVGFPSALVVLAVAGFSGEVLLVQSFKVAVDVIVPDIRAAKVFYLPVFPRKKVIVSCIPSERAVAHEVCA